MWISDKDGLVTARRDPSKTSEVVRAFARPQEEEPEGEKLIDTIHRVGAQGLAVHGALFILHVEVVRQYMPAAAVKYQLCWVSEVIDHKQSLHAAKQEFSGAAALHVLGLTCC